MANINSYFEPTVFSITEGNKIDMASTSIDENGFFTKDGLFGNKEYLNIPLSSTEGGEYLITKPYVYFHLAFHRGANEFPNNDNREVRFYLNGTLCLQEEPLDKNSTKSIFYNDYGLGSNIEGLFIIRVPANKIPYPLTSISVYIKEDDDLRSEPFTVTQTYDLTITTGWENLGFSFGPKGFNARYFGKLVCPSTDSVCSVFGGYKNYVYGVDLGTNAHEDKKNFNFFKDNLYIKSNKIDFFGSKSVPGSVYFNNDSNTQLNIVSPYATDDEYCLYITGDLPEIINSIHLNFLVNIEGIETIFTVSAPFAIKGENNIIRDFNRYRAEIDVQDFTYREIIERQEDRVTIQSRFDIDLELDTVFQDVFSQDFTIFFGDKDNTHIELEQQAIGYHKNISTNFLFRLPQNLSDLSEQDLKTIVLSGNISTIQVGNEPGSAMFYIYGTDKFSDTPQFIQISDKILCNNKENICKNAFVLSRHKIYPTSKSSVLIPGFVVLPGECFELYDRIKCQILNDGNEIECSKISGTKIFEYDGSEEETVFYPIEFKDASTVDYFPYIIHFGRVTEPELKSGVQVKGKKLMFGFKDNGSDRTIEKSGNVFVYDRLTKGTPFSFSRDIAEGLTDYYERLKVTVFKIDDNEEQVGNSVTWTYIPITDSGTEGVNNDDKEVRIYAHDLIKLLQENQTNNFDLSLFSNILPANGGKIRAEFHFYYENGDYSTDLFELIVQATIKGTDSPFGLRSNGIIINPISGSPEDVPLGYAEKINVLSNGNIATPIQVSVRDSINDILGQCEIQYNNGKWYFNDINTKDSSKTKAICLSDLTVSKDVSADIEKLQEDVQGLVTTIGDEKSGLTKQIGDNTTNITVLQNGFSLINGFITEEVEVNKGTDGDYEDGDAYDNSATIIDNRITSNSICFPIIRPIGTSGEIRNIGITCYITSLTVQDGQCQVGYMTGCPAITIGTRKWKVGIKLFVINLPTPVTTNISETE